MMKRFITYFLLFMLPFGILLLYYVIADPFYVVWRFRTQPAIESNIGSCNDALRGIQWMNMHEDSLHYNSFIEGSSRSDFYYVDEWKKYIGDSAVCFHFNQSGDNLQGTLERVRYLYNRFERIDNILFIMDREYLQDMSQNKGHLFRNPWQVTDEWDFFAFHWEFIKAFLSIDYQKNMFASSENVPALACHYDSRWNEDYKEGAEELLNSGQYEEYYGRFTDFYALYDRDTFEHVSPAVVKGRQIDALEEIACLLKGGNTDYRVVISPLYNQEKLNPEDLAILKQIFGEDKIFDFSGINEYTSDKTNYYKTSHYRPRVCNDILKKIYQ